MSDYAERLLEITECELCDEDGVRLNGLNSCDHIDYGVIARRHMPAIRAALKKGK